MGGKEGRSACCVVTSVKVSAMCYGPRSNFAAKLQDFIGEGFQDFQSLDSKGKSSLWEENSLSLLRGTYLGAKKS